MKQSRAFSKSARNSLLGRRSSASRVDQRELFLETGRKDLLTRLAGVKVSSTSNRTMVFLMGRCSRVGMTAAVTAAMVVVLNVCFGEW